MDDVYVLTSDSRSGLMHLKALEKLLLKAKKGDSDAFGQLYTFYFEKVYKFLYYRTSHKETSEDLAEEVFSRAYAKLDGFEGNAQKFLGWIMVIARNRLIDHYRKKDTTLPLDYLETLPAYEKTIVEEMYLSDDQKILVKRLQELPQDQQTVLKLKFLEGYEVAEVASMLGKSEGNIRILQFRALKNLKSKYQTDEE